MAGKTVSGYIWAIAKVCRFEYLKAEFPALLIPVFFCAVTLSDVLKVELAIGIPAFLLLYWSGFSINAYTDYEIDQKYASEKPAIAKAVDYIGKENLKWFVAGKVVVAMLANVLLSFMMNDIWPIVLAIAMAITGLGYSAKPFEFKTRGVLSHALGLGACVCFIPIAYVCYLIAGEMRADFIVFTLGFTIAVYALEYGNQSNDYIEDKAHGIMSPSVRLGIPRAQLLTIVLIAIGIPIMLCGMNMRLAEVGYLSFLGLNAFVSIALVALVLAIPYSYPVIRSWKMIQLSKGKSDEELVSIMPKIKACCPYHIWQAMSMTGIVCSTAILFVAVLL